MTNTITILALSTVILSVTLIPLAEASVGWNGFLRDIGFGGTQVYEVSDVSIIPAIEKSGQFGNKVQLRCLDGDWLYSEGIPFSMTAEPFAEIKERNLTIVGGVGDVAIHEIDDVEIIPSKLVGYDVTPRRNHVLSDPFEIAVTISILCLSPSPLSSPVGGEWQATDTVALFIGYSVLNAYWLAPTLAGLGAGIYLTKTKWKR